MTCFLGIDGGGTKTEAVLLDDAGYEMARATVGPANYHAVGQEKAERSLRAAIHEVLDAAGIEGSAIYALGLGMAGAGRAHDQAVIRAILARIQSFSRVFITHDAEIALLGAVGQRYGVVLVAGTGAIGYGVNAQGQSRRADGWGYLLGDEGSAYWIGREGLRAVARAADGRGPGTALAERLLARFGLASAGDLIGHIYAESFGVSQVAALAPLVDRTASDGDAVAQEILERGGQHLSRTLSAVILGLHMSGQAFDVALTGGVLHAQSTVWAAVVTALAEIAPRAQAIAPRHDAAYGAALLAQRQGTNR